MSDDRPLRQTCDAPEPYAGYDPEFKEHNWSLCAAFDNFDALPRALKEVFWEADEKPKFGSYDLLVAYRYAARAYPEMRRETLPRDLAAIVARCHAVHMQAIEADRRRRARLEEVRRLELTPEQREAEDAENAARRYREEMRRHQERAVWGLFGGGYIPPGPLYTNALVTGGVDARQAQLHRDVGLSTPATATVHRRSN